MVWTDDGQRGPLMHVVVVVVAAVLSLINDNVIPHTARFLHTLPVL